ncbi:hypothetical protein [Xanthomonas sp. 3058]|uniref:hypothetical protein n=1 Tax=Xanthomonas sp. 3058 TaxID=3035314 RepID=UPI00161F2FF8|nr:hypothetical protein [Xanthomonas sp. 3058]MBB5866187.1 hypothetical protein [Xanthomonas sp. 3058]
MSILDVRNRAIPCGHCAILSAPHAHRASLIVLVLRSGRQGVVVAFLQAAGAAPLLAWTRVGRA